MSHEKSPDIFVKLKKNEKLPVTFLSPIIPNSKIQDKIVYNENFKPIESPNGDKSYLNWVFYVLKDEFLCSPKYLHVMGLDLEISKAKDRKFNASEDSKERLEKSENRKWNDMFPNDQLSTVLHFRQEIKRII